MHLRKKKGGSFSDVAFSWETNSGLGYEDTFVELAGGIDEVERGGLTTDHGSSSLYKLKVRRPGRLAVDLQPELLSLLDSGVCEITTSGTPFVEITALGSDKASGLEKTATQLGFAAAETIAFGDNHNDLPMFRWVGHAVAMGNSVDGVKAEAHSVTLSNTEHGVAHYLEKLLER